MNSLPEIDFLSSAQVSKDPNVCKTYGKDWTTYFDINAAAVLFPKTTKEVSEIVKWARKNKISLVPSGGRTGLSGAACALNSEVIVSFEQMNKIKNFNSINQTVDCEAGVITENLQKFARDKNLLYPVDFAARGSSQIGGNIATNAGGIKVVRYGLTRDWVSSLTFVTGTGDILELGKSLVKNATGYDLRHLVIGSEGTLGFVTEATIRLTTAPKATQVLFLAASSLEDIMEVFGQFKQKSSLIAFEMLSERALQAVLKNSQLPRPLSTPANFYLVIEVEITAESDEENILQIFQNCLDKSWITDGTISQSDEQAKVFWRYREDISESLSAFSPYKNDVAVSISEVPEFVKRLQTQFTKAYPQWEVVWFGHIGDGNLHINILRPPGMTKEAFVQECRKADLLVFESVKDCNGSISAEHGVGLTKKSFLNFSRSDVEIQIMRQIKRAFDPDGIINPGKVFDL